MQTPENENKPPQLVELQKQQKIFKQQIALPDWMRVLQERFLNEHNIDAFLSMQDEEVLEFFHQNYNQNHHQRMYKMEEVKSSLEDIENQIIENELTTNQLDQLEIVEEDKEKEPMVRMTKQFTEGRKMMKREQDPMF